VQEFEQLKKLVAEAELDVLKGASGNRAAAVRARKAMQEIKAAAQNVRLALLGGKEDAEGSEGGKD
jgi:hypothetical protein